MKYGIALFAAIFLAAACGKQQKNVVLNGFAQGSTYHIVIAQDIIAGLCHSIDSLFDRIDESLSIYNKASQLSKINRTQSDSLDDHLSYCINYAQEFSRMTNGMFDVTVMPLVRAYGFGADKAVQSPNVDSLLQFVGYEKISIKDNRLVKADSRVQIDLNAIAQGYTVDKVAELFDHYGYENYLIEIGGEIYAKGEKPTGQPWIIGIDSPREGNYIPGNDLIIKLKMKNRGLATSGNYRKFYTDSTGRKIVHTINPITGEPVVSSLLSATVIAKDAATADVLGTYLMLIGTDAAKEYLAAHPEIDALLIYDQDGEFRTFRTPNLSVVE